MSLSGVSETLEIQFIQHPTTQQNFLHFSESLIAYYSYIDSVDRVLKVSKSSDLNNYFPTLLSYYTSPSCPIGFLPNVYPSFHLFIDTHRNS